jgi:hypothetical protein
MPAAKDELPSPALAIGLLLLVVLAAVLSVALLYDEETTLSIKPEGIAIFAPLYVAAQAIERLLEPLASLILTPNAEKNEVKEAREVKLRVTAVARAMAIAQPGAVNERGLLTGGSVPDERAAAVNEQTALGRLRHKKSVRKLVFWALASIVSVVVTAAFGLGIFAAMAESTESWTDFQHQLDVALTGLVIGAGTKPLHDLITRLEKAKDNADPATKPTEKLPGTPAAP